MDVAENCKLLTVNDSSKRCMAVIVSDVAGFLVIVCV